MRLRYVLGDRWQNCSGHKNYQYIGNLLVSLTCSFRTCLGQNTYVSPLFLWYIAVVHVQLYSLVEQLTPSSTWWPVDRCLVSTKAQTLGQALFLNGKIVIYIWDQGLFLKLPRASIVIHQWGLPKAPNSIISILIWHCCIGKIWFFSIPNLQCPCYTVKNMGWIGLLCRFKSYLWFTH